MKIALAFLTKDKPELSARTVEHLLDEVKAARMHLFWIDGSDTESGRELPTLLGYPAAVIHFGVRGGPDAAIVYALTMMLEHPECYDYVGLVEQDVLLYPGWLQDTMALFDKDERVGAASPRCYADRILIQCDGYAIMHNLGAGVVIFSRRAAQEILCRFRTTWSTHNRVAFAQATNIDIGRYWAFKGGEHWLTADWGFDRILIERGLLSLACTPSKIQMIGQTPALEDQGLQIADREIDEFRNPVAIDWFERRGDWNDLNSDNVCHRDAQGELIFVHQLPALGGKHSGWRLLWQQGFGPFAWRSDLSNNPTEITIQVFGPCNILVTGAVDTSVDISSTSGFTMSPKLADGVFGALFVPGNMSTQTITISCFSSGVLFHGIQCPYPQKHQPYGFNYRELPPV